MKPCDANAAASASTCYGMATRNANAAKPSMNAANSNGFILDERLAMPPMPAALRLPLHATGFPAGIGWMRRFVHPLPNYIMTIEKLQEALQGVIDGGMNNPTDKVVFRNCKERGELSEVDYVLTAVEPETLTLCWDDGHF